MGSVRSSTVCMISASIAGFCGGRAAAPSDARGAAPALDEVRTRRLVIVDDQGEERGHFEVGQGSASSHVTLWMGGPDQKGPSATLWIDELEGTPTASLLLRSEYREHGGMTPSTGRLSLRCTSGLPSATLTSAGGSARGSISLLGPRSDGSTAALVFDSGESRTEWPPR